MGRKSDEGDLGQGGRQKKRAERSQVTWPEVTARSAEVFARVLPLSVAPWLLLNGQRDSLVCPVVLWLQGPGRHHCQL